VKDLENYLKKINWQTMLQEKLSNNGWTLGDDKVLSLKEKIDLQIAFQNMLSSLHKRKINPIKKGKLQE
jgi:hypothetical protein